MATLALAAVVYLAGYWLSLKIWPYTGCGKCGGTGRNGGSNRKRWGYCRKCGGSGRKWRLGVRVFMHSRTIS
jgi:DnaJ-class molecular chaperone